MKSISLLQLALSTLLTAGLLPSAFADDAQDCARGDGTLLVGTIISGPTFRSGKPLRGIPLTHTHVTLRGDPDGKTYDIAIDDVFASGYDARESVVPAPLNSLAPGERLELCGLPYSGGMHWVHNNCGDDPTPQDPNGWLKVIAADGSVGPNLENSRTYCYLWPKGGSHSRRRHHRSNDTPSF